MTVFTAVWHDSALNELMRLWMAAADRQSITKAADAIDRELACDAGAKGVLVDDELRELTVPPLRVLFFVSEPDRLVKVTAVAPI